MLEDVFPLEIAPENVDPARDIQLINLPDGPEKKISGSEILRRFRLKKDAIPVGQVYAEYLFAHHDKIPENWKGLQVAFLGTIWKTPEGSLCTFGLYWAEKTNMWEFDFGDLDGEADDSNLVIAAFNPHVIKNNNT